jgi:hypothetical protein
MRVEQKPIVPLEDDWESIPGTGLPPAPVLVPGAVPYAIPTPPITPTPSKMGAEILKSYIPTAMLPALPIATNIAGRAGQLAGAGAVAAGKLGMAGATALFNAATGYGPTPRQLNWKPKIHFDMKPENSKISVLQYHETII